MDSNSTDNILTFVKFSNYDYGLFVLVLLISLIIGVYFGFYKKQKTMSDYLLGGKKMSVFPIAVSLAASYTSAITILGMPSEIYTYGTQYAVSCLGGLAMAFVISIIYLPVFYNLKLTSSYEYLSLRFDKRVRYLISTISIIDIIIHVPVVIFSPTIVLNLVTGVKIGYTIAIVSLVCIFYTAIGGLKSVVWTDAIQYLMMNGAIFAIIILGVPNEGGLKEIWRKAEQGDRIEFFNMSFDLSTRLTFWSVTVGLCTAWINGMGVNQTCVQRFLAVPTLSDAKKVLYIYVVAITIVKALCLFSGMIIFARYSGCDPLTAGFISKPDQILPYYVMDATHGVPGLPGVFIAGIFSAALSTMSTNLNTAGGILYKDYIMPFLGNDVSEKTSNGIMKIVVTILGLVTMILTFYVEKLGNIVSMVVSLSGITVGAMLGTFTLGMLSRRANSIGVITGSLTSIIIMAWTMLGNKIAVANGKIKYPYKSFSMDQCITKYNITTPNMEDHSEEVFFLYKISFTWYALMGTSITLLVGYLVSCLTEPPTENQIRPEHLSPVIRTEKEKEYLLKWNSEIKEYSAVSAEER